MSNIETTDIRSTVIGTVRNLKKKRPLFSEESHLATKTTSLQYVDQDNIEPKSVAKSVATIAPSKKDLAKVQVQEKVVVKKRKVEDINIPIKRNETEAPASLTEENRANVFDRLAQKSIRVVKVKAKAKEQVINFFDPQYQQTTISLLEVVFERGKSFREYVSEKELSFDDVMRNIFADQHFMTCLKGLLTELQKTGEINRELQSISKQTFMKIESFVIDKIENKMKIENMDGLIAKHTKMIQSLTQNRLANLKSRLANNSNLF